MPNYSVAFLKKMQAVTNDDKSPQFKEALKMLLDDEIDSALYMSNISSSDAPNIARGRAQMIKELYEIFDFRAVSLILNKLEAKNK